MSHHHSHSGSCSHHPVPTSFHTAFAVGAFLNTAFVAIEFFFGWWAHSLALMADAAHNLGDVLSLLFAWLGYSLSQRTLPAESRFTFGLGRVSIYATVFNGLTLVVSAAWIGIEAVERLSQPETPLTWVIGSVALVGIVVNGLTAWLLARGQNDVNIKGAMLHMIGDAAISAGVVLSAVLMAWTAWYWIDPVVSLVIAALILWSAWPILREGVLLALDAIPGHVNRQEIIDFLNQYPGLTHVHTLHIWPLSTSKTALSAHITPRPGIDNDALLRELRQTLQTRFQVGHITLQIETDPQNCTH